jgi:hypothetical protein
MTKFVSKNQGKVKKCEYLECSRNEIQNFLSGDFLKFLWMSITRTKETIKSYSLLLSYIQLSPCESVRMTHPNYYSTNKILVCVEYATNYKLVLPLSAATGEKIAQLVEERIIGVFGAWPRK